MKIYQEFHLKQTYHEIRFFAYDILEICRITPYNLSKIFVPECGYRDTTKGCDFRDIKGQCCVCYAPHLQELWLDGWIVGDKYGFLNDDSYYAKLQTGIRVPVNKEIYDAWKEGWSTEPHCSDDKIYELS